jgi:hypothetical protein
VSTHANIALSDRAGNGIAGKLNLPASKVASFDLQPHSFRAFRVVK